LQEKSSKEPAQVVTHLDKIQRDRKVSWRGADSSRVSKQEILIEPTPRRMARELARVVAKMISRQKAVSKIQILSSRAICFWKRSERSGAD
jgi:hypothetical protein